MEPSVSYLESTVPIAACEMNIDMGLLATRISHIIFYLFDYPLLPALLPPHHHRHSKKEDYERRAKRLHQN
jgi:hypothetical protein